MATRTAPAADTALVQGIITQVGRRVVGTGLHGRAPAHRAPDRRARAARRGARPRQDAHGQDARGDHQHDASSASSSRPICSRPTSSARMVFDQWTGQFSAKKGPIFANIILADEINRAPAKVQAALLEAMQEKQVTIGGTTYTPRGAVPRPRDAKPDRAGRDVPAPGGAGRSLHAQAPRRLPDA